MSMNLATRPARLDDRDDKRQHLEVVTSRSQRQARPRTMYAMITVATLLAIVVAQLALSIAVTRGAYRIDSLQTTQRDLQRNYQAASEDLNRRASPQNLAANAAALGMVANTVPVYLRLSDGAVLGKPARALTSTVGSVSVPNALLKGMPLVTQRASTTHATETASQTGAEATSDEQHKASGASKPAASLGPVVLDGELPSPKTH